MSVREWRISEEQSERSLRLQAAACLPLHRTSRRRLSSLGQPVLQELGRVTNLTNDAESDGEAASALGTGGL